MARPDVSERGYQTYGEIGGDSPFNAYLTTLPLSIKAHTTQSGGYKYALVVLAILVRSCFGLHQLCQECTDPTRTFQAHLAPTMGSSDTQNCTNEQNTFEQHNLQADWTRISTPRNTAFARRQNSNAKSTFFIPTGSREYQFTSNGWTAQSTFKIKRYSSDKRSSVSNYVKIEVKISRNPNGAAKASTIGSGSRVTGVMLSASNTVGRGPSSWPSFEVLVFFPVTSRQRLQLGSLDVRLPQFHHEFDDLSHSFVFSRVSVASADAQMNLGAITATDLRVSNAKGNIRLGIVSAKNVAISNTSGRLTYNSINGDTVLLQNRGQIAGEKITSSRSLTITNVNWGISGEFTLMPGSTAKLSTQNAPIVGRFVLKQEKTAAAAAKYSIQATSTNHPLNLKVAEQPLGSSCNLEATSSSNVQVHMPRTFEGTFRVTAAQNKVNVETAGKRDPAGRGRQRFVEYSNPRSKASGRTGWGKPNDRERHGAGTVTLSSTGGQAQLVFD